MCSWCRLFTASVFSQKILEEAWNQGITSEASDQEHLLSGLLWTLALLVIPQSCAPFMILLENRETVTISTLIGLGSLHVWGI